MDIACSTSANPETVLSSRCDFYTSSPDRRTRLSRVQGLKGSQGSGPAISCYFFTSVSQHILNLLDLSESLRLGGHTWVPWYILRLPECEIYAVTSGFSGPSDDCPAF